jgi:hypothetical protein
MRGSRYLIGLLLAACIAAPILIGASCPPPANPFILGIIPDTNALQTSPVPPCIPDFVCINLANGAKVPVQMALYKHNGFDPNNQFADPPQFSCCTNPNSQVACPCPCPGQETGNCRLDRTEIFQPINLTAVNGLTTLTLAPNQGSLVRFRCGDVKTIGAAVADATGNVLTAPDDRAGPVYRGEFGGVPCGQTVQFLAVDLNQTGAGTGSPAQTATLIIQTTFSQ